MLILLDRYMHTFTIGGSASGADFLSDSSLLADGRPSAATRCQWIGGAQTTASYTRITATLTNPAGGTPSVGGVAVLGISGLPVGLQVVFNGDSAHPVSLVQSPTGGLMAIYVPATPIASGTITVDFKNNVGGSTSVAASATFEVGEIMCGQQWSPGFNIDEGWSIALEDPSMTRTSANGQGYKLMRMPRRVGKYTLDYADWTATYGVPAGGVLNLQDLSIVLATSTRALFAPRWQTPAGAVDQAALNATAIFGEPAMIGEITNVNGVYFRASATISEVAHG